MSPDGRTKELVRYRIERFRLFAVAGLAAIGGVLNLLLGELSGRRLFLALGGIVLLVVLVGLINDGMLPFGLY